MPSEDWILTLITFHIIYIRTVSGMLVPVLYIYSLCALIKHGADSTHTARNKDVIKITSLRFFMDCLSRLVAMVFLSFNILLILCLKKNISQQNISYIHLYVTLLSSTKPPSLKRGRHCIIYFKLLILFITIWIKLS